MNELCELNSNCVNYGAVMLFIFIEDVGERSG